MTQEVVERRLTRRRQSVEEHSIVAALVRPGINASVVDVSEAGVLIETHHRLLPGSSIDIHVDMDRRLPAERGRVLRCAIVHLKADLICYRGAVLFDRHLPWLTNNGCGGYAVPSGEMPLAPVSWARPTQSGF
jgi:hypothetical protein